MCKNADTRAQTRHLLAITQEQLVCRVDVGNSDGAGAAAATNLAALTAFITHIKQVKITEFLTSKALSEPPTHSFHVQV